MIDAHACPPFHANGCDAQRAANEFVALVVPGCGPEGSCGPRSCHSRPGWERGGDHRGFPRGPATGWNDHEEELAYDFRTELGTDG